MDTGTDFITPEFLHLLFFKQKSLVIFPHVDLKHLSSLEIFTAGYSFFSIDSSMLNEVEEILGMDTYSNSPSFYLIYNLIGEKVLKLVKSKYKHCILNTKDDLRNQKELLSQKEFIVYNKKTRKFLNQDFSQVDLSLEQRIFSNPDKEILKDQIQKVKTLTGKIYTMLNKGISLESIKELIAKEYGKDAIDKILHLLQLYYNINLSMIKKKNQDKSYSGDNIEQYEEVGKAEIYWDPSSHALTEKYEKEYERIKTLGNRLRKEFISLLGEVESPALDFNAMISPEKKYTSLRKSEWSQGIPLAFLKKWMERASEAGFIAEIQELEVKSFLKDIQTPQPILSQLFSKFLQEKGIEQEDNYKGWERQKEQKEGGERERDEEILFKKYNASRDFTSPLLKNRTSRVEEISYTEEPVELSPPERNGLAGRMPEMTSPPESKKSIGSFSTPRPSAIDLPNFEHWAMSLVEQIEKQIQILKKNHSPLINRIKKEKTSSMINSNELYLNNNKTSPSLATSSISNSKDNEEELPESQLDFIQDLFLRAEVEMKAGQKEEGFRIKFHALERLSFLFYRKLTSSKNGTESSSEGEKEEKKDIILLLQELEALLHLELVNYKNLRYMKKIRKRIVEENYQFKSHSSEFSKLNSYLDELFYKLLDSCLTLNLKA